MSATDLDAKPDFIPEGYDSVDAFLLEMRERFDEADQADRLNREMGMEDLEFLAGNQWDPKVKAQRDRKKLPSLTINTLPQYVGQIVGDIRINRPSIRVRPAEDGDKKVAEVRQGLIRFIENQSNAQQVYALAGEDQVGGGLGHFRVSLEWAKDDSFDRDLKIKHVPNPFAVVWDPMSIDPTGADARYCFVVEDVDRATFEKSYPDAVPSTLEVTGITAAWAGRDTVKLAEYWVMKPKEATIALTLRPPATQPSIEDITGKEAEAQPFIVPDPAGRPRMRKTQRWVACMYLTNGLTLLEENAYELPISRLPIFKVSGREVRAGTKRYRFGIVRFAKDPARFKNLWRSSAAQWLAQAPRTQWLVNTADEEEQQTIADAAKTGQSVIGYTGQNPPLRMDPPSAPSALLQQAEMSDQDIKDVTGLHDASLGMTSNETSGKAILAREKQGDVATFMYHDNLHSAIRECGKVLDELIPVVFDRARTVVVLGEDGNSTPTRVNDPQAEEPIDLKVGKYDVVLEVGPSYSTKRAEAAESMAEFARNNPNVIAVAGDLFAKAQDWPMADTIAERLKRALPPGVADDDEEDMTPEQQQVKAQAAQQAQQQQAMQQEAAMVTLEEGKAKVRLTNAQAAKMMAEAKMTGQPTEQGPTEVEFRLQLEELRKAKADADLAEAKAERERVALAADIEDLKNKPLERAHSEADLDIKMNPPEPEKATA
mgnify:CR=1 FL=1